jgi:hypothetical protein
MEPQYNWYHLATALHPTRPLYKSEKLDTSKEARRKHWVAIMSTQTGEVSVRPAKTGQVSVWRGEAAPLGQPYEGSLSSTGFKLQRIPDWKSSPTTKVRPGVEMVRHISAGMSRYTGVAVGRYKGIVTDVIRERIVVVKVYPANDWDRWDAYLPLASFDHHPEKGDEFECHLSVEGSGIHAVAHVMKRSSLPSLEELGIDAKELLDWASKLDV